MTGAGQPLVRVRNLWAGYAKAGPAVVKGMDLDIEHGQVLCLLGGSGAGKSTVGHILAGAFRHFQYRGTIEVDDISVSKAKKSVMRKYRGIVAGLVSQDPEQFFDPLFKVGFQLISAVRSHISISKRKASGSLKYALSGLGLADPSAIMNAWPHELSGGMKTRAALALAVVLKPRIIVADEVFSALDPIMAVRVLDMLKQLIPESTDSILLITHDLAAAARISDRVAVMLAGYVVESGSVDDVLTQPLHPYTYSLIEAFRMNRNAWVNKETPRSHKSYPDACPFIEHCAFSQPDCAQWRIQTFTMRDRTVACLHPIGTAQ